MTDYRRRRFPGGYYFFTVITHNRRPIFKSDAARRYLRQAWVQTQSQRPFKTVALCLMPDHLHCVWKLPEDDFNYSDRWSAIKSCFTRLWLASGGGEIDPSPSRRKKRERGIWQRRFWEHQIRDWEDLERHVLYIHTNPLKHGLVEHPQQWPWSTWHKYYKRGFYSQEPSGRIDLEDMFGAGE